ncbi:hypothetical protein D3C75_1179220 [compost metagenome]
MKEAHKLENIQPQIQTHHRIRLFLSTKQPEGLEPNGKFPLLIADQIYGITQECLLVVQLLLEKEMVELLPSSS